MLPTNIKRVNVVISFSRVEKCRHSSIQTLVVDGTNYCCARLCVIKVMVEVNISSKGTIFRLRLIPFLLTNRI